MMSLDNSDNLDIPDANAVDLALEAVTFPKFDMHLYKSSLTETHVKWLIKCYKISKELHPRVVSEGMAIDELPNDVIEFVADPFPKPEEFKESDVERLRKIVITLHKSSPIFLYVPGLSHVWKHAGHVLILKHPNKKVLTMAEFFRLPNFRGYKVVAGTLLPPEKCLSKKKKVEAKAVTKADDDAQVERVIGKRRVGEEGTSSKKKKTRQETLTINLDSEHVSSPTLINHSNPLETVANEMHIFETASLGRLDALRNQTDEQGYLHCDVVNENVDEHMADGGAGNEQGEVDLANKGHVDNAKGLSGLRTQPSLANQSGYSARRFGDLPFTPQWGLTDSSRIDNSHDCRDMLANLFTPADNEFLNYGALSEEHVNLAYAHESCKEMKARYKECKKEIGKLQSAYDENVFAYDQLLKDYDGALNIKKGLHERDEELERKKGLEEVNAKQVDRIKQLEEELKSLRRVLIN
nr:hypothetical protein [Tanacetum cinerariifolium]